MTEVHKALDDVLQSMISLSEDIYKNPELGYKEFKTRQKVIDVLQKAGIEYEDVAYTGIVAELNSNKKGPTVGLICELDAVPTLGHPYANPVDNAAHTCGHYAQIGVMLSVFLALHKANTLSKLCGKVKLLVTPAEEFCDMEYRKQLIQDGKISHSSGKREMIATGVFDDVDIMLSCHTMGLDMETYHAEIGASLNGFLQKTAIFHGKATHAGANPEEGINALNAANLAMAGINFLRETFLAEDAIRVHFVLSEGGQTVNTVPARTQLDMYVRARTVEAIRKTDEKVNRALRAGALAIGCGLEIYDTPGYFPLHQDEELTEFVKQQIKTYIEDEKIAIGTHGFASGDMGDISMMWPTVEIGIAGFRGTIHGNDFETADEEQAYRIPAYYFADTVIKLLENNGENAYTIKEKFQPVMTKEEYLNTLKEYEQVRRYDV